MLANFVYPAMGPTTEIAKNSAPRNGFDSSGIVSEWHRKGAPKARALSRVTIESLAIQSAFRMRFHTKYTVAFWRSEWATFQVLLLLLLLSIDYGYQCILPSERQKVRTPDIEHSGLAF
jgi:hypothetical protein